MDELLALAKAGDEAALEKVLAEHMGLVRAAAKRLAGLEESEDLIQLGSIGLLKAVRGYDPSRGTGFASYAFPFVAGEMKHSLRRGGCMKVSRGIRELAVKIRRLDPAGSFRLSELAAALGIEVSEAALALGAFSPPIPLSSRQGEDGAELSELLPDPTRPEEALLGNVLAEELLSLLEGREAAVLRLRVLAGFTQKETAERLGLSQPQISRTEKKALAKLKEALETKR